MSAAVHPTTKIRPMRSDDLQAVARIERAAYAYPWSEGIFRDCLLAGYHGIVLETGGLTCGYAVMSMAGDEAHILNLCVHPSVQGMGHGRRLMNELLYKAEECGMAKVYLEVRPSNHVALSLYESANFKRVGLRPCYYQAENGREDAAVLELTLRPSS